MNATDFIQNNFESLVLSDIDLKLQAFSSVMGHENLSRLLNGQGSSGFPNWFFLVRDYFNEIPQTVESLKNCGIDFEKEFVFEGKTFPAWTLLIKERKSFLLKNDDAFSIFLQDVVSEVNHPGVGESGLFSYLFKEGMSESIEVLANRGARPSTEELPQISQIVVKYGGNKVLSDLLAQLMLSDERLEDVYESTLFLMDRLKNIKDSTPIIEAIDSHFDQFSEEQKKILMQHALGMQNMRPAQLLSGKMGCSVKTRKGLLKVLPLIDYCTNPHWANKILNEGLLTEKVSNEFGETTGLQAFSNAMLASFSIYYRFWGVKDNFSLKLTHFSKKLLLSFGSGQKYKTIEDYTQKISEGIRGIENEKLFSFLLKKDEFGNYLVRSERRNFKKERFLAIFILVLEKNSQKICFG